MLLKAIHRNPQQKDMETIYIEAEKHYYCHCSDLPLGQTSSDNHNDRKNIIPTKVQFPKANQQKPR